MKLIAWKTWTVVQVALLILLLGFPPHAHAALSDTGLIVRYYVDEATSGTGPGAVLDGSGVGSDFDLTIDYGGNMTYNEVSTNSGLDATQVDGDGEQRAEGTIDDADDKIRNNLEGAQKMALEIVVRVDNFNSGGGRAFAINESTSNAIFGFLGTSGTVAQFYWNETLMRTWDPGTARANWLIAVDSTQGTADDRVKVYKGGSIQSPTVNANPGLNDTLTMATGSKLFMFNRGDGAGRDRSMDGMLFYGALYSGDFLQARVTTHDGVLGSDDDTPAAPGGGIGITGPIVLTGPIRII